MPVGTWGETRIPYTELPYTSARELRQLLELSMPEMDGVEALQRIREHNSEVRVAVFTALDTDEQILAEVQAGAQGYILKGAASLGNLGPLATFSVATRQGHPLG